MSYKFKKDCAPLIKRAEQCIFENKFEEAENLYQQAIQLGYFLGFCEIASLKLDGKIGFLTPKINDEIIASCVKQIEAGSQPLFFKEKAYVCMGRAFENKKDYLSAVYFYEQAGHQGYKYLSEFYLKRFNNSYSNYWKKKTLENFNYNDTEIVFED